MLCRQVLASYNFDDTTDPSLENAASDGHAWQGLLDEQLKRLDEENSAAEGEPPEEDSEEFPEHRHLWPSGDDSSSGVRALDNDGIDQFFNIHQPGEESTATGAGSDAGMHFHQLGSLGPQPENNAFQDPAADSVVEQRPLYTAGLDSWTATAPNALLGDVVPGHSDLIPGDVAHSDLLPGHPVPGEVVHSGESVEVTLPPYFPQSIAQVPAVGEPVPAVSDAGQSIVPSADQQAGYGGGARQQLAGYVYPSDRQQQQEEQGGPIVDSFFGDSSMDHGDIQPDDFVSEPFMDDAVQDAAIGDGGDASPGVTDGSQGLTATDDGQVLAGTQPRDSSKMTKNKDGSADASGGYSGSEAAGLEQAMTEPLVADAGGGDTVITGPDGGQVAVISDRGPVVDSADGGLLSAAIAIASATPTELTDSGPVVDSADGGLLSAAIAIASATPTELLEGGLAPTEDVAGMLPDQSFEGNRESADSGGGDDDSVMQVSASNPSAQSSEAWASAAAEGGDWPFAGDGSSATGAVSDSLPSQSEGQGLGGSDGSTSVPDASLLSPAWGLSADGNTGGGGGSSGGANLDWGSTNVPMMASSDYSSSARGFSQFSGQGSSSPLSGDGDSSLVAGDDAVEDEGEGEEGPEDDDPVAPLEGSEAVEVHMLGLKRVPTSWGESATSRGLGGVGGMAGGGAYASQGGVGGGFTDASAHGRRRLLSRVSVLGQHGLVSEIAEVEQLGEWQRRRRLRGLVEVKVDHEALGSLTRAVRQKGYALASRSGSAAKAVGSAFSRWTGLLSPSSFSGDSSDVSSLSSSGAVAATRGRAGSRAGSGNWRPGPRMSFVAPPPSIRTLVRMMRYWRPDASHTCDLLAKACGPMGSRHGLALRKGSLGRCAVVAPSRLLLSAERGAEIDAHDSVLRFGFSPVHDYEYSVGTKTSVRFLNAAFVNDADLPESAVRVLDPAYPGDVIERQAPRLYLYAHSAGQRAPVGLSRGIPFASLEAITDVSAMAAQGLYNLLSPNVFKAARGSRGRRAGSGSSTPADPGTLEPSAALQLVLALVHSELCTRLDLYGFKLGGADADVAARDTYFAPEDILTSAGASSRGGSRRGGRGGAGGAASGRAAKEAVLGLEQYLYEVAQANNVLCLRS
eukprot:jgi/Mesvir1/29329/Mv01581-RA.1